MKEKFRGGGSGGQSRAEAVGRVDGRAPSTGSAHLPGPLSAALGAQPRRLPRELALLTDFVLLLSCFTASLIAVPGHRSGTFTDTSGCLPNTSSEGTLAAGRENPDNRCRQIKQVTQRLKLPAPPWPVGIKSHSSNPGTNQYKVFARHGLSPHPQASRRWENRKEGIHFKYGIQEPFYKGLYIYIALMQNRAIPGH